MAWIVNETGNRTESLHARIMKPSEMKVALSPLAWKILKRLSERPYYPKELSKKLKMHEQKIYYHIRNLEKAKLVKVFKEDRRQGAITKYYSTTENAFALTLKPLQQSSKLFNTSKDQDLFLEPFIQKGKFNATIVLGSNEPHGPTKEIGHDGMHAANLALFLGTFLNYAPEPCIKFDTEIKNSALKKNLILIGGPAVNSIISKVNAKLPISFSKVKYKNNYYDSFHSNLSNKTYSDENYGIIAKIRNPYNRENSILVVGGRKFKGTKAAMLAFMQNFETICKGNKFNSKVYANVVGGLDMNNDGRIDSVEFLE